ncbi:MAG: hypothetical protein GWN94_17050 [Phycisphaerae bacterium]|nr:hypothetical protein [Phycisphaerae bacterium]
MATQVDICNLALDMLGAKNITALTEASKEAALSSRLWEHALDEALREFPWNFARKRTELEYTPGFGIYATTDEKDITGITQADPAVVTVASHGWQTDYYVKIDDVSGMTEINERVFQITRETSNTFSLPDIDSSDYTAYTSGGTAIRYEADPDYADGYTYDLPSDYLCDPTLDEHPAYEFEIIGWDDGTNCTRRLLTTVEDAILLYTASMTSNDVAKFPAHFVRVLAATLARMLHRPLHKKGGRDLNEIWSEYAMILAQAKLSDAGEHKEKEGNYKDPWLEAGGYE